MVCGYRMCLCLVPDNELAVVGGRPDLCGGHQHVTECMRRSQGMRADVARS